MPEQVCKGPSLFIAALACFKGQLVKLEAITPADNSMSACRMLTSLAFMQHAEAITPVHSTHMLSSLLSCSMQPAGCLIAACQDTKLNGGLWTIAAC